MAGFVEKLTHVAEGLDNLIGQFKGKPKIEKLLTVYLRKIQELEGVFADLLTETTLANAVGIHLDNIGDIVGEKRSGRTDAQYRTAISARIELNTSEGTIEDLISLAIAVSGAAIEVDFIEEFPAGFTLDITTPVDLAEVDTARIAAFLRSARSGGVQGFLTFHTADPFQYDTGLGYDDGAYGGAESA